MKKANLYKWSNKKSHKLVLKDIYVTKNLFEKSFGLMFAGKKKCENGMLFEFLKRKETRFGASITMFFCFYSLDIIFINKDKKIVDKTTLKPFKWNYTPKKKCVYVIESIKDRFKNLKVGDLVSIELLENKNGKIS
jgi:uncharacterized protein